ncbi:MAG: hypothetical protein LBT66_05140 [Methanobrevibacter sp.]|jgi:hypothetical protein|nr:hypothetical protein [Candidatus Methanovirga meridionalis]
MLKKIQIKIKLKIKSILSNVGIVLRGSDALMAHAEYLSKNLYNNPKYLNSKRITHYGKSSFSQNGEDGIIQEIFNRIKTTNKYFVEFGLQDGLESNTALLLLKEWEGLWIEANEEYFSRIEKNFKEPILKNQLKIKNSFITPENIESIFKEFNIPKSPDLMSIDIDSTDYWVWKAIKSYTPRVLIIEYNSTYFPPTLWIQKKTKKTWDGDINYGASLQALHDLGGGG